MTDQERLDVFQQELQRLMDEHGISISISPPRVEQLGDALLVRPSQMVASIRAPAPRAEPTPEQ